MSLGANGALALVLAALVACSADASNGTETIVSIKAADQTPAKASRLHCRRYFGCVPIPQ